MADAIKIWLDTSEGMVERDVDGPWAITVDLDILAAIASHTALPDAHHPQAHSHPELGDINFTGSISSGGEAGLTGQRTIDGHILTFKNGLLVGYQAP